MQKNFLIKKTSGIFQSNTVASESDLKNYFTTFNFNKLIEQKFIEEIKPPVLCYAVEYDDGFSYVVLKEIYDNNPHFPYSEQWHMHNLQLEYANEDNKIAMPVNEKRFSYNDLIDFIKTANGYNGSPFANEMATGILSNALSNMIKI